MQPRPCRILEPSQAIVWRPLAADRKGQYSIRINDQWRICFGWADTDALEVEIVDYH